CRNRRRHEHSGVGLQPRLRSALPRDGTLIKDGASIRRRTGLGAAALLVLLTGGFVVQQRARRSGARPPVFGSAAESASPVRPTGPAVVMPVPPAPPADCAAPPANALRLSSGVAARVVRTGN